MDFTDSTLGLQTEIFLTEIRTAKLFLVLRPAQSLGSSMNAQFEYIEFVKNCPLALFTVSVYER
jgi:hypothetical protein